MASCTASSALAQAVLVHTAGCTLFLDVFKAAGILSLPDVAAATEEGAAHYVYYDMTEDRNKFMAYCMAMREGDFFSSDKVAFNWPGGVDDDDKIGNWALDKLSMALSYPLVNKDVFSGNPGLVGKVHSCWKESDAVAKPGKTVKPPRKPKAHAMEDTQEDTKLSPEQIEKIVPLMLRHTQVGSSVQALELHGKGIEEQIDMFTLSKEMIAIARDKCLRKFKYAEGHIAYISVSAAKKVHNCASSEP